VKSSGSLLKGIDRTSVLVFLLLIIMGWLNIYAAVYNDEHKQILDFSQRYGKQFLWIMATMVLAIFILLIDSRFYLFFSWFFYAAAMFLLFLVLIFGKEINGSKSWFEFGPIGLQPSEFAKFATALALAGFLNHRRDDLTKMKVILPALAIILFPAVLTLMQPDLGSTIIFFALFIVLFREGLSPYVFISGLLMIIFFFLTLFLNKLYLETSLVAIAFLLAWFSTGKWKACMAGLGIFVFIYSGLYLLDQYVIKSIGNEALFVISVVLSGIFFSYYIYAKKATTILIIYLFLLGSVLFINSVDFAYDHLLKPHQRERVEILLGRKTDTRGTGYNANQAIISVGSGGFIGKGFLRGTQTKFKFVPAQSTDFIFCTVGEEWGFLGSLVVIGLFVLLLIRLIMIAERQRSAFSRIYGYGVVSILFIHFFINIGMAIGLVPVIGIPLPFFSYGGSSLWGFTILLFIFLRLDAGRSEYLG
jgi:rod shape determining protein RodA